MKINFGEASADDLGMEMEMEMEIEELKAVKVVGKGAMGTVFLIQKRGFDRPLALKAMSKSVLEKQKDGLKRARVEKEILSSLRHPFLPTLFGQVDTEKIVGWVVDYCSGGDLNGLRRRQPEKIFSENVIRFYAAEIILALEHLHSVGIVYRDLKPENVLVQEDGHIMLTDFDLSAVLRPPTEPPQSPKRPGKFAFMTSCVTSSVSRVSPVNKKPPNTKTNSLVGTEEYVSPEMLEGGGHDFPVDWWAFGVLLYELSSGKTPFTGATRKDTFYNVLVRQPPFSGRWTPLRDLIQRLLIKDPKRRLGFNGVEEIKSHFFFRGLDWESIEMLVNVTAPPFVPSPVCMDDVAAMQRIDVERHLLYREDSKNEMSQSEGNQTDVFSGF
ncbi:hypothetical protein SUGI_0447040 [Cryptomeria japonica]|uniref:serine/threonine-protein kinase OXI1 n=1 Tax=Cryptomeria japonica TaxID=3369 RepID=UPI002408E969|nr:serine/threonine-protein kinase OXI1 [Cryptomeria japonica]GLJ23604.1 hypothetical protein SUGI_0447040 [Cryptomeria japonica]